MDVHPGISHVRAALWYCIPGRKHDIMYRQCAVNVPEIYTQVATKTVTEVQLEGRGVLKFECDWGVGIGGGLWSTGILLTQHLCKHAALYESVFRGKRVLELGSGTGLVGEGSPSAYTAVYCCVWRILFSLFSNIFENQKLYIRRVVYLLYNSAEEEAHPEQRFPPQRR